MTILAASCLAHAIGIGLFYHYFLAFFVRAPEVIAFELAFVTFYHLSSLRLADQPSQILHPTFDIGAFPLRPKYIATILIAQVRDENLICYETGFWGA